MLAKMLAITAYLFRMHGAASKNTFKRDRGLYDFEILHISLYYANLEDLYDKCPAHDIKIVRGDLDAKVGSHCRTVQPPLDKFPQRHDADRFCRGAKHGTSRFQHLNIHKAIWLSPDRSTRNQKDHVVIDGRHVSNALDVRT